MTFRQLTLTIYLLLASCLLSIGQVFGTKISAMPRTTNFVTYYLIPVVDPSGTGTNYSMTLSNLLAGINLSGPTNWYVPFPTTLAIGGTAGHTTVTPSSPQDLSANRTWVVDLASSVVTPGTYRSLTVDTYGRATGGTTPTTFAGYALSDTAANLFNALTTWDFSKGTNQSYLMPTNNPGGSPLSAGAVGTPTTCLLTNITVDTTLAAMTFWNQGMSVIPLYVSCSGGANHQLKFPSSQYVGAGDLYGVDLAGTGDTITNGEAKWFEIRCIYGVKTNVFHSPTK